MASGHPPSKIWALWAKGGDIPAHRGLLRPLPCLASPREGKGGGLAPPAFPSHGRKEGGRHPPLPFPALQIRKGGRSLGGSPSRIPPTWAPPLAAPPSHLYICGR